MKDDKNKGTYLLRFMDEYQNARMNLELTDEGYTRHVVYLYPDKLAFIEILLHLGWVLTAIYFALGIPTDSTMEAIIISAAGMVAAFIVASFIPLDLLLGSFLLIVGAIMLPYNVWAGAIGIIGLTSLNKRLSRMYGKSLVKRWCVGSEDQFIRSIADKSIIVTANQYATDSTRKLLKELEPYVGSN